MAKNGSPVKSNDDWRSEDDHRTMMSAQEIQADGGRMRGVRKVQKKKTRALSMLQRRLGRGR